VDALSETEPAQPRFERPFRPLTERRAERTGGRQDPPASAVEHAARLQVTNIRCRLTRFRGFPSGLA
jgi:hypothetical protein